MMNYKVFQIGHDGVFGLQIRNSTREYKTYFPSPFPIGYIYIFGA